MIIQEHESFFDRLKQLIRVPSVIGSEHPFFMAVKRELEEMDITVSYYQGLLVAKGKSPESGYISAHSDRHGLVCTGPNEFQYAAFIAQNKGDLTGESITEQIYKELVDRFCHEKVQAYDARSGIYLGMGTIIDAFLCDRRGNMIFNIEGLEHILPGTPIAFSDKLSYKDGYISAQIDNVISVAIIVYLYEMGYQGTAFFSAGEEIGRSWRYLLEWFKRYDKSTKSLLVLDTSPFPTKEHLKKYDVVLRNKDANDIFDKDFIDKLKTICIESDISYVFKDEYIQANNKKNGVEKPIGSTELGRLVKGSNNTINGATLQLPTTEYHTVEETTTLKSIEKMLEMLKKLYNLGS